MFYSHLEIIPIYGQLGLKQEALEAWHRLLKRVPWRIGRNLRELVASVEHSAMTEVARLMEGVYKSGVLGAEAKAGQRPGPG